MERSTDKLARYIMYLAGAAAIIAACWYFRTVLVYIIAAAVVSLIGRPIKKILKKVTVKGEALPDALLAVMTQLIILLIFVGIITELVPVIYSIVQNISANMQAASYNSAGFGTMLDNFNIWMITTFPNLEPDFSIQEYAIGWIKDTFDLNSITSVVGSVASTLGNIGIGIFCVVFISFFFIKDEKLFSKIIASLVPDRIEKQAIDAIGSIEHLLSRYFVGLITEVLGVALLNFLGLWLIARLGFQTALGIAFMTGLLNIIPYVGPWIGAGIGTVLGLVLKFSSAAAAGGDMNWLIMLAILVGIFAVTQMVDNFLFQPIIYSTSIKSHPLEIFIVLIMAGHLGGIFGMLVAIPAYTVIRVIAIEFFGHIKAIRRLTAGTELPAEK
ncbi:MAG: AI-2E family transporter [Bacteroidales bacterium]|nr:AI-2E family transporter [Bacteroidales bacterium]